MPIITLPSIVTPSYSQGFARNKSQSASPWLWDGLRGMWVPALGKTGLTLFDVSGQKNHGVLTNMVPADAWVAGEQGYALEFDDSESSVNVPGEFLSRITNEVTFVYRFFSPTVTKNYMVVASTDVVTTLQIGFNSTDARLYWAMKIGGSLQVLFNISGAILSAATWYTIVIVYDGSTAKSYIDGALNSSTDHSGAIDLGTNDLLIGKFKDSGFNFEGKISDFAIYDRALLPAEIRQLARDHLAPLRLRDTQIPIAGAVAGGLLVHPGMAAGMQIMAGGMRG